MKAVLKLDPRTIPAISPLPCANVGEQTGDPFEVACSGCLTQCDRCSFEDPRLVPICAAAMVHAVSAGGTDTLEGLSIERGYWRATASGEEVLAYFNPDTYLGGETGTPGYCLEGYEGPCE